MTTKDIQQQIETIQSEIDEKYKSIRALRLKMAPELVDDFLFRDKNGDPVWLSALFDERDELLVIHNMGVACSYCTMWADGINGLQHHINARMPMVLVSPDTPAVQSKIALERGWKFKMLSAADNSFIAAMGFEPRPKVYSPGCSAFIRKEHKIYRTAFDFFGPNDAYNSTWHFFDLFPKGDNDWQPE